MGNDVIYIYNPQTGMGGQAVPQSALDRCDDPDECPDWDSYTADDLPFARDRAASAGADGGYAARVAATLEAAFGKGTIYMTPSTGQK